MIKLTTKLNNDYKRLDKLNSLSHANGFVSTMSKETNDTLNIMSVHCYIKIHNFSKVENDSEIKVNTKGFNFEACGTPEMSSAFNSSNYETKNTYTRKQVKTMLDDLKEQKKNNPNSTSRNKLITYDLTYKDNTTNENGLIHFDIKLITAVLKLVNRIMLDNKLTSLKLNFMPMTGKQNLRPMLIDLDNIQILVAPVRNF